jgi:ribosome-binding factor A
MSGAVKRASRVAERMREAMAAALRSMRDPRIEGALVSRIELTDDLQLASIYVRRELGADDVDARRRMLRGLEAASGRLRRDVSHTMDLRYAPTLRFFYDDAPDAVTRVEEILHEIKSEGAGKDAAK